MSETLLIHYNPADAHQASWSLCNNEGELTTPVQSGKLDELTGPAARQSAVILLHSQCLHINQLQLPAMNMQKLMRAVPYAVEEFIASDVEDFHFVAAVDKTSKSTAVVGIEQQLLQNILDLFRSHGVFVDAIIPDVLCINGDESQWSVLRFGDDCYLQTGRFEGVVSDCELLPMMLQQSDTDVVDDPGDSAQTHSPQKLLVFSEQDDSRELPTRYLKGDAVEVSDIRFNHHPLVIFCSNYRQAESLNLLQQKFKQRRESTGYWRYWKLAASLAAFWLVLSLSITGYQGSILSEQNEEIDREIAKIFKQTFPSSRLIPGREKKLMQDNLDALLSGGGTGSDSLLFLLTESFGTLKSDPDNITLRTLTYRNSKIEIGLEGRNLQAIENLNNKLNASELIKAEITSSSAEKDKVRGNIRIEGREQSATEGRG